jgi:hypothetical protein
MADKGKGKRHPFDPEYGDYPTRSFPAVTLLASIYQDSRAVYRLLYIYIYIEK